MKSKIKYISKNLITGAEKEHSTYKQAFNRVKFLRHLGIGADIYVQSINYLGDIEKTKVQVSYASL